MIIEMRYHDVIEPLAAGPNGLSSWVLNQDAERQRTRGTFYHQTKRVCFRTFLFFLATGKDQYANIKGSCSENGIAPRVHGNTIRLPVKSLTFDDVSCVITFIRNYAEDNAVLLPGRIPGYKRSDLHLLQCSTTKSHLWKLHNNACELSHSSHETAYTSLLLSNLEDSSANYRAS